MIIPDTTYIGRTRADGVGTGLWHGWVYDISCIFTWRSAATQFNWKIALWFDLRNFQMRQDSEMLLTGAAHTKSLSTITSRGATSVCAFRTTNTNWGIPMTRDYFYFHHNGEYGKLLRFLQSQYE